MKTIKMYLNYSNFYKLGKFAEAPGEIYDKAEIIIPDNWELAENHSGDILIITDTGARCLASEIQTAYPGNQTPVPYLPVVDKGCKGHNVFLKANIKRDC